MAIIIPDGISPIRAVRAWQVDSEQGLLQSLYRNVWWPQRGSIKAECLPAKLRAGTGGEDQRILSDAHRAPAKGCICGIYALRDIPKAGETRPWPKHAIIGRVELWGKIVEGDLGYRAEFARPISLIARPRSKRAMHLIRIASAIYDLPIEFQSF